VAGKIRSNENSNDLIRIRTYDLPACSIVRQPTALPHAPRINNNNVACMSVTIDGVWIGDSIY
jgi:hypothetical protein